MRTILVTGGTGFIGSHTSIGLLLRGYKICILDSLVNSKKDVLQKIKSLTLHISPLGSSAIDFVNCDIRDSDTLEKVFIKFQREGNPIDAVLHFAGLKAVGESVRFPIEYWANNVGGTINLLLVMKKYNCKTIIFSSSASIYGDTNKEYLDENTMVNPANPYAKTKSTIEGYLKDIFDSDPNSWRIANLRYFNPIGAHPSGEIGENPLGIPNNIFPKLIKVACKEIQKIEVFGRDWDTPDGTGIRDYIHVMDLADGHICALEYLRKYSSKFINLNLGTGIGYSVLDLIHTFSITNNVKIPYIFAPKRPGDVSRLVANNNLAIKLLNWLPKRNLKDMCRDGWNWHKKYQLNL